MDEFDDAPLGNDVSTSALEQMRARFPHQHTEGTSSVAIITFAVGMSLKKTRFIYINTLTKAAMVLTRIVQLKARTVAAWHIMHVRADTRHSVFVQISSTREPYGRKITSLKAAVFHAMNAIELGFSA